MICQNRAYNKLSETELETLFNEFSTLNMLAIRNSYKGIISQRNLYLYRNIFNDVRSIKSDLTIIEKIALWKVKEHYLALKDITDQSLKIFKINFIFTRIHQQLAITPDQHISYKKIKEYFDFIAKCSKELILETSEIKSAYKSYLTVNIKKSTLLSDFISLEQLQEFVENVGSPFKELIEEDLNKSILLQQDKLNKLDLNSDYINVLEETMKKKILQIIFFLRGLNPLYKELNNKCNLILTYKNRGQLFAKNNLSAIWYQISKIRTSKVFNEIYAKDKQGKKIKNKYNKRFFELLHIARQKQKEFIESKIKEIFS